jgi:hypothetical protein
MRTVFRYAALALAALSLAACVSLKEPIGTSVGYRNDPALEGLWLGKPDKDKPIGYYHVIPNADDSFTVVGIAPKTDKDKASWGTLAMTTVKLGPNRYMNVRETGEDGGPPKDENTAKSTPAYYELNGDTLAVFAFDADKVAAEVNAGRVAGIVHMDEQKQFVQSVEITADGPALDAWLSRTDARKLFVEMMEFKRAKPPQ